MLLCDGAALSAANVDVFGSCVPCVPLCVLACFVSVKGTSGGTDGVSVCFSHLLFRNFI